MKSSDRKLLKVVPFYAFLIERNVSTTMRQPVFEIRLGLGASVLAG